MRDFVTPSFKKEIEYVIKIVFSNLNINHQQLLLQYLAEIIDIIAIKFNFDDQSKFENQFRRNNYRDIKGLLLLLLPFIDDENETKKKQIRSLNEIYVKKESHADISSSEPKYTLSNLQYGRCNRTTMTEIKYDNSHLYNNFCLLKQTIQMTSNKLYVNWIDILPMSMKELKESALYKETKKAYDNHNLGMWDVTQKDGMYYSGLYIGDFYNVISHYLFAHIKNIKWVIYDTQETPNDPRYPYLIILGKILPLQNCLDNTEWNSLSIQTKTLFKKSWDDLIQIAHTQKNIEDVPHKVLTRILKAIMIFFNKYYSGLGKAIEEGEYIRFLLPGEVGKEGGEDAENIGKADITLLEMKLESLHPKHMYEFLKNTIQKLKPTWYYSKLTISNKLKTVDEYKEQEYHLTLKNIYNYAKSMTHYKKRSYLKYPNFWRSLSQDDKRVILGRLNWNTQQRSNSDLMDWFNISRYFMNTYDNVRASLGKLHGDFINNIRKILVDIVFEVLANNGILSKFEPNKTGEIIKDIKKWNDAHYFITSEPYKNLNKIITKDKEYDYLDFLVKVNPGEWPTIYAMNWISQISFYHRYINNRVIFVTGATGVGKSTQVPKLLLYALKMIDYKSDGNIIVTQPRIPPTESNSGFVSKQMGVPIEEHNRTYDKNIRTQNYYVQYKHQFDNHTKDKTSHLTLKFVTDGTLYQTMKNNPLFKKTMKKYINNKEEYLYGDKNTYDIVIIDEAHEHNKNMDLILTMMKYALHYNNDLKLVIISATMDDDEPVYRRFYRDINDNRSFPFDSLLQDHNLDRINVDRRVHISPPGKTTRFPITEHYEPDKEPEEIAMHIINTKNANSGDILLFQPGQREIMDTVKDLNEKTSSNTIAVPYYSKLDPEEKKKIEDLNDKNKRFFTPIKTDGVKGPY